MRIHWLQHVPFEGLGQIEEWAHRNSHCLSTSHLYLDESLPDQSDYDMLIIMGGPMGVYDEEQHPWLRKEKAFISEAVLAHKTILGVCLGAQLLAVCLGAKVMANPEKEIGWFPITKTTQKSIPNVLLAKLPESQTVFHWHGDTFELPEGAVQLYSSLACENQAFLFGKKIIGLQFHLETNRQNIESLITSCGSELVNGDWIQLSKEMLSAGATMYKENNALLQQILDYLASE